MKKRRVFPIGAKTNGNLIINIPTKFKSLNILFFDI